MIPREEAIKLKYPQEVFYAVPPMVTLNVRPERHIVCRVNGKTILGPDGWFATPVRIGASGHATIGSDNNQMFHMPGTCPCRECAK